MFCPRCGTENNLSQKYCRRCGLQLATARISLQGGVGEALAQHKKGEIMLSGGSITLVIFVLAALANFFLSPGGWNYPILINLVIGLLIAVPITTAGLLRLRHARRVLNPKDEQAKLTSDEHHAESVFTSSTYSTDPLMSPMQAPGSVTDHTTLQLKSPESES